MASGGNEPVSDAGRDGHSVFAYALLQALRTGDELRFTASDLFYTGVRRRVAGNSSQIPKYSSIRNSGDDDGDFIFLRTGAVAPLALGPAGAGQEQTTRSDTQVDFEHAKALYEAHDFDAAVSPMQVLCRNRDMRACSYLGSMYLHGDGFIQDYVQAVALSRESCDGGGFHGCSNLGLMYEDGKGLPQDNAQSVALYRKACDGGDPSGCSGLGSMYLLGKGVNQDTFESATLYRKACDGGDAHGCTILGHNYNNHGHMTNNPNDYVEATAFFCKGCDGGDPHACWEAGNAYRSGRGVAQDLTRAAVLYRKACEAGDSTGCESLKALNK